MDQPFRVVVVGGGSAGYLAALTLQQLSENPGTMEIVVLDPAAIPPIGVGESTTSEMPVFLHRLLGIDVLRFYRAVEPTWKLGIRFEWGADEQGFYYPFDRGDLLEPYRHEGHFREATLGTTLMSRRRAHYLKLSEDQFVPLLDELPHGYHIDNARLLRLLREVAIERGIEVRDDVVEECLRSEGGGLSGLRLGGGRVEHADLYVDCTGFRSEMVHKALGERFISFESSLFCDRAWTGRRSNRGDPAPYTTATTMESGWLWSIPQRDADHVGYVYSSRYCDDDHARRTLEVALPGVEFGRRIKFRSGRLDRWISGNTAAIGNAYGFVEPLESTALFVIVRQCLLLARNARALARGQREVCDRLNLEMGAVWDYLRWFLAIHYRFNRRSDSTFWRDCRETVDIQGAEPILARYREAAPRFRLEDDGTSTNFDAFGLDVLLLGQQAPIKMRPSAVSLEDYRLRQTNMHTLVKYAVSQGEALTALELRPEFLAQQLCSEDGWVSSFERTLRAIA